MQRALRAAAELVAQAERLPFGVRARCGVCTGEVVAAPGTVVGGPVAAAERLARAGEGGEVRMDESTWRLVRHAARASEVPGGFLLASLDAEAPAIQRRLDRPLSVAPTRWPVCARRSSASPARVRPSCWRSSAIPASASRISPPSSRPSAAGC